MFILGVSGSPDLSLNDNGQVFGPARCCYIMVIVKEMCGGVVETAGIIVIFVWVPACGGHFLATESRWILQRLASNILLTPGGFLRNLGFQGVGEWMTQNEHWVAKYTKDEDLL